MIKKILSLLIITSFIFTFSACDSTNTSSAVKPTTTLKTTTTKGQTTNNTKTQQAIDGKTSCGEDYLDINKNWKVTFSTNLGDFVVTLDPKNSPIGSAHLASLVNSGFYNNLTFHRIVKGFVIQGGDPQGNGSGSSDCSVISEAPTKAYVKGDFAWAKTGDAPNGSAGSQFFIVTDDSAAQSLTNQYGTAGSVTSGMDIVTKIENVKLGQAETPAEKVTITKATLSES
ncbi:MAG: peptidylprolyl isomerase [Acidimicrobiia bacterium]|nr:peptidylprolyl isomerase [Acidimicrobiia bacterium]